MTTLKILKEATTQSLTCPSCGKQGHIEFGDKTKQGLPKSYRVCNTGGCDKNGERQNITGLKKTKHGIDY